MMLVKRPWCHELQTVSIVLDGKVHRQISSQFRLVWALTGLVEEQFPGIVHQTTSLQLWTADN